MLCVCVCVVSGSNLYTLFQMGQVTSPKHSPTTFNLCRPYGDATIWIRWWKIIHHPTTGGVSAGVLHSPHRSHTRAQPPACPSFRTNRMQFPVISIKYFQRKYICTYDDSRGELLFGRVVVGEEAPNCVGSWWDCTISARWRITSSSRIVLNVFLVTGWLGSNQPGFVYGLIFAARRQGYWFGRWRGLLVVHAANAWIGWKTDTHTNIRM